MIRIRRRLSPANGRSAWVEPANIVATLAFVVSFAAFAVSVRGCSIAQHTLDIQRREFQASRQIVLTGEFGAFSDTGQFAPTDGTIAVQKIEIYLPTSFNDNHDILHTPFTFDGAEESFDLWSALNDVLKSSRASYPCTFDAALPVVLASDYTYKGERLHDRSVYELQFLGYFSEYDKPLGGKPHFSRLRFIRRMVANEGPRQVVDAEWNRAKRRLRCRTAEERVRESRQTQ